MAIPAAALARPTLLERAREIAPLLEARAEQAERERTLPAESVAALAKAGILRACLPPALGGEGAEFGACIEAWEEISRADGSAGWTAMANATAAGAAAHFLPAGAARSIFGEDPAASVGGQFAPRGTGLREGRGWRVTGSFSFGSGTAHSGYVAAGFLPLEDGRPVMEPSGLPRMLAAFIPRDQIAFTDNWHVMGLRGTGSYDYEVRGVHVPEDFAFRLFEKEPRHESAVFRMGMMPITASGHAALALGVGRRALDEVRAMAHEKTRMGHASPLAGRMTFQRGYAAAEAKLRAARLYVQDAFGAAIETSRRGDEVSIGERAAMRLATCFATDTAREVADFAHDAAGTAAIRDGSLLHRAFLDLHTGSLHAFINERVAIDCAEVMLGLRTEVPGL
jgi:alkylation response protein AidB-like acyl-CoA dehydrogenase